MHKIKNTPIENDDAANKEYTDTKAKIFPLKKSEYDDLYANGSTVIDGKTIKYDPETYYIITDDSEDLNILKGEVEFASFTSTNTSVPTVDDIIPIDKKLYGNIEYNNGYKLKKNKTYLININIGTYTGSATDNAHLRYELKFNSDKLKVNGISIPFTSTSTWSDTQISTIYTPSEDGLLTINCVSIDNISGLLDGFTNVSIMEIIQPTSINNLNEDYIKNVVGISTTDNTLLIKNSTTNNKLGGRIYLEKDSSGTSTLNGNLILDFAKDMFRIIEDGGKNRGCYVDISTLANYTTSRILTTSIADVPLTTLTLPSTCSGNVTYIVKNGYCTVSIWGLSSTSTGDTTLYSSMPKSSINSASTLIKGDEGSIYGLVFINKLTTSLIFRCYKVNIGASYLSFTYPVSES